MDGSRFIFPADDLRPYVWVYVARDERVRGGAPVSVNRFPGVVYPSLSILLQGEVEATWGGGGARRLSSFFVSGAVTRPVASANLGTVLSLTVLFRPGVLPHFAGERPALLVDTFASAEDFWPREAAALRARVSGMTVEEAFPLVETFLRTVFRDPRRHGGFEEGQRARISGALAQMPIGTVVAGSGLSLRQFERRFMAQFGVTPKLFQQLQRFERAGLALRAGPGRKSLASIAAECGYFDQAHLAKEFQRFSGVSPKQLLRNMAQDAAYWAYRMELSHD